MIARVGSLEVDQDLRFERRVWRIQRAGWVGIALVLLAALSGALGGTGPLAQARVAAPGLEVSHRRLCRSGAEVELELRLSPAGEGPVRLGIDTAWLSRLEQPALVPAPERVEADATTTWWWFARRDDGPLRVHLRGRVHGLGPLRCTLRPEQGGPVELVQFCWP